MNRESTAQPHETQLVWFVVKLWLVVTVVALLVYLRVYRHGALLVEALIYLGLLLFLVRQKPLMTKLAKLPRHLRYALVGLVAVLIGGQLANQGANTFPIVEWAMYTQRAEGDPVYYEYRGMTRSGKEVMLPISRLYPTLDRKITWQLKALAASSSARYESLLRQVVLRHNHTHPDDPLCELTVYKCTIPLHATGRADRVQRSPFRQLSLQ